jgi:hypothetical protein
MYLCYLDDAGSPGNPAEDYLVPGGICVFEAQVGWFSPADYYVGSMDGIGIVILGAIIAFCLFLLCIGVPKLRRYAFAALVSPFVASVVFLIGSFVLADMNPALECGSEYVPNGTERDPTNMDVALWLLSVIATLAVSAVVCVGLQRLAIEAFQHFWKKRSPIRIDLDLK